MTLEVLNLGLDEAIFYMKRNTKSVTVTHEVSLRKPPILTGLIDVPRKCTRLDCLEKNPYSSGIISILTTLSNSRFDPSEMRSQPPR
ncbi:hypothetical protein M5689_021112 [Euphorbia peplus]|nr:hypothetical protein M5689_021112 [Euphorbia peplus]